MQHRDPPHYLKALTTTRTPDRLVWLDCAASITKETGAYVQRFDCAALGTTHYTRRLNKRADTLTVHDSPLDVWQAVDKFCTRGRRVVLFSYDLAQQIRISQAMVRLPRLGWSLDNIVLERTAAWALYRHGDRSLMMCDLRSWVGCNLSTLASDISHGAVRNVEATAGPQYKSELCMIRAQVVRDAVLQILEWIEGENLGPFRPTGSGQSYSAYRRRFMRHNILVHDQTDRLEAERLAMHTGRCEAWQHGQLVNGPFVEYDMHAAYCTIVRDCEVPTVAQNVTWNPSAGSVERAMSHGAVLAHVTVTTDVPVVPTRLGGRTVWPVGTFDTWLWDSELRLCFEHATDVRFHRAYRYLTAPALRDFGQWVLDGMGQQTQVYGMVPKRVLKHWSRCLVGRLGLRYRSWEKFATTDDVDLRLVTYIDTDEGVSTDLLIAGHDWLLLSDMAEALESVPQIPSWVMSECRRRLWAAMEAVGFHSVVYVDTDSIIVQLRGEKPSNTQLSAEYGEWWSHKGAYRRMTIHGPRNYATETDRHVAGLPLSARQVAPLEFTGQVMRSIKESMRAGELDCVTSIPRKFIMDAPDLRRQHLPNHQTAPFRVQPTSREDDA